MVRCLNRYPGNKGWTSRLMSNHLTRNLSCAWLNPGDPSSAGTQSAKDLARTSRVDPATPTRSTGALRRLAGEPWQSCPHGGILEAMVGWAGRWGHDGIVSAKHFDRIC